MLIDTHCHLDAAEFDADRVAVIQAAGAAGVEGMVVPAVEVGNFGRVQLLAHEQPQCVYALGIHPMYVDRADDLDLGRLQDALSCHRDDPALVAVGEIGLDHFVPGLDRERQSRFFGAQLKLAQALDLPVILHVRHAQDQVLKHLRQTRVRGGIAHAFNGSLQQAQAFINLGFVLGFGGAMTFERALRIRRLASELPAEAIVLETDAPDIAPAWVHPGRNQPEALPRIAATLATLRRQPIEAIARQTSLNALRVLPRLANRLSLATGRAAGAL